MIEKKQVQLLVEGYQLVTAWMGDYLRKNLTLGI